MTQWSTSPSINDKPVSDYRGLATTRRRSEEGKLSSNGNCASPEEAQPTEQGEDRLQEPLRHPAHRKGGDDQVQVETKANPVLRGIAYHHATSPGDEGNEWEAEGMAAATAVMSNGVLYLESPTVSKAAHPTHPLQYSIVPSSKRDSSLGASTGTDRFRFHVGATGNTTACHQQIRPHGKPFADRPPRDRVPPSTYRFVHVQVS